MALAIRLPTTALWLTLKAADYVFDMPILYAQMRNNRQVVILAHRNHAIESGHRLNLRQFDTALRLLWLLPASA